MLFKPEYVAPIIAGEKVCTTRYRKHAMVKVGNIYKAKTHRYSKEYFALIKVVQIRSADFSPHRQFGLDDTGWLKHLYYTIGYQDEKRQRFAEKEGFDSWYDFRETYMDINAHHRDDPERKHWIIDFGVVNEKGEFIKTKFVKGDWVSWERYGTIQTAQVLDIVFSEWNQDWCYKLNCLVNNAKGFWDWEYGDKLWSAVNPLMD